MELHSNPLAITVKTQLSARGLICHNDFLGCGLNRGDGLFKSTRPEGYHTVKKIGIISYVLYKKLLERTKTLMHFDSNVNRDEMNEKKVAKTVIRIKC